MSLHPGDQLARAGRNRRLARRFDPLYEAERLSGLSADRGPSSGRQAMRWGR